LPPFLDKIRIPVTVAQRGLKPVEGHLFLLPVARFHDGPETVLDLLNTELHVVPFEPVTNDGVFLLTRMHVDWVRVREAGYERYVRPTHHEVTHTEPVEITLVDGQVLRGRIEMELPPDLNRASDFLKGAGEFYPLTTDIGTLIVNKGRVLRTRLFRASPAPIALADE
jgi:hypothetical protein